jgi:SprT-like family.
MYFPAATLEKESAEARVMRRVKAVWTEAKNTYQIREPHDFKLAFMNHATIARLHNCSTVGAAAVIRNPDRAKPLVLVRINKSAVEQNLERVLDDVIPHELAHIVCMLRPQYGHSHNHDAGWQAVCKRLGGSGLAVYPAGAFNL